MFADRREEYLRENKTAKARGNVDMIKAHKVWIAAIYGGFLCDNSLRTTP